MRRLIFYAFFLIKSFGSFAQEDSIITEIQNYPDNQSETISKARRLIIDKLYSEEYQKIKQIKDYLLIHVNGKTDLIFGLKEYWLILFWIAEYDEMLEIVRITGLNSDSIFKERQRLFNSVMNDQFQEKLLIRSRNFEEILLALIQNSQINEEDKDFLRLHLTYCLSDISENISDQDSLNFHSEKFLMDYPWSIYSPFIKKVIQYKVTNSDFAMGYDFFGGFGDMEGNISDNFVDLGYLGFSFNFYFYHFNLDMSISLGVSKLKRDIQVHSNTWNNGLSASIVIPQCQLGYTFLSPKRLNFTPFIGISGTFITPVYEDILIYPYLENVSFNSNICWSTGISLNLYSKPAVTFRSLNKSTQVQLYLKLKYTYSSISYSKITYDFNGQMHQVSFIFGCILRKIHRII